MPMIKLRVGENAQKKSSSRNSTTVFIHHGHLHLLQPKIIVPLLMQRVLENG